MTSGRAQFEKELAKRMKKVAKEKENMKKEIQNLEGEEKIKYEIGRLKSTITNCKFDLMKFPDNGAIRLKLENAENQLADAKAALEELRKSGKENVGKT